MARPGNMYYDEHGDRHRLGRRLAGGGEGEVFELETHPGACAKLFYDSVVARKAAKVEAMLSARPKDPMAHKDRVSIAWPEAMLFDRRGNAAAFAGYRMRMLDQVAPLERYILSGERQIFAAWFNWRLLHHTARNLARAIRAIHAAGHCVGDLNPQNVLVSVETLLTLVDTDSFQIRSNRGEVLPCKVGVREYLPPEYDGTAAMSPASDHYSLAVLTFRLLMLGEYPVTSSERDAVINGDATSIHPAGVGGTARPGAVPFDVLPRNLQDLFKKCFGPGLVDPRERPTALEWADALDQSEKDLRECQSVASHRFSSARQKCPWCERREQRRRDPFPAGYEWQSEVLSRTLEPEKAPADDRVEWLRRTVQCLISEGIWANEKWDFAREVGIRFELAEGLHEIVAEERRLAEERQLAEEQRRAKEQRLAEEQRRRSEQTPVAPPRPARPPSLSGLRAPPAPAPPAPASPAPPRRAGRVLTLLALLALVGVVMAGIFLTKSSSPDKVPGVPDGGLGGAPPEPLRHLVRLRPSKMTASGQHELAMPDYAFDENSKTAWKVGVSGAVQHPWLEAQFATPVRIRRIVIATGIDAFSDSVDDWFELNSHLKRVRVLFDGVQKLEEEIRPTQRQLVFGDFSLTASSVRFVAQDLFPGTVLSDFGITEIELDGESALPGPPPSTICAKGRASCESISSASCETDVTSNPKHCGRCSHSCLGGSCDKGVCRPFTIADHQSGPIGFSFSDSSVYWLCPGVGESDGAIRFAPMSGGSVMTFVQGLRKPAGFMLDRERTEVFWSESEGGRVRSRRVEGGATKEIANEEDHPGRLRLDDRDVYWIANQGTAIRGWSRRGRDIVTLVEDQEPIGKFTLDRKNLYWVSTGTEGSRRGSVF
jgi:hypothetical protein